MTREQKQYLDSFRYEAFMKRAFRSDRNFSKGIDNSVFRLLEHIENGHASRAGGYAKQVEKIKSYLAKAIGKALKWKLTAAESLPVRYHADCAQKDCDGDDLAEAIGGLLEATRRFKEY